MLRLTLRGVHSLDLADTTAEQQLMNALNKTETCARRRGDEISLSAVKIVEKSSVSLVLSR